VVEGGGDADVACADLGQVFAAEAVGDPADEGESAQDGAEDEDQGESPNLGEGHGSCRCAF
jgi:hypothetical protein